MDTIIFFALPLILLPVFITKSEWGLAVIAGIAIFFGEGWHPGLHEAWTFYNIDFINIHIMEVLIYSLLITVLINRKILSRNKIWIPPYSGIVFIFLLLMILAAFHGFLRGASPRAAFGYGEWRALFLTLLLLILVPNIIDSTEKVKRLLNWIIILATLRACIGVGNYWLGQGQIHATLQTPIIFWDSGENMLFAALIVISIAEFLMVRPIKAATKLRGVACLPMAYSVIISMRRNVWLFMGVAIFAMFMCLNLKQKMRFIFVTIVMIFTISIGLLSGVGGKSVQPVIKRIGSFTNTRIDTNPFHLYDIYDAFLTIKQHPWMGVGFGNGFIRMKSKHGVGAENIIPNIVHNIYLHIWLKMGIFGLLTFLLIWIAFIAYGLSRISRITDLRHRALVIGIFSIIFGMLGSFIWGTYLFANTRTPLIMFIFLGLFATLLYRRESTDALNSREA